jgi:hypothetical protein
MSDWIALALAQAAVATAAGLIVLWLRKKETR